MSTTKGMKIGILTAGGDCPRGNDEDERDRTQNHVNDLLDQILVLQEKLKK